MEMSSLSPTKLVYFNIKLACLKNTLLETKATTAALVGPGLSSLVMEIIIHIRYDFPYS